MPLAASYAKPQGSPSRMPPLHLHAPQVYAAPAESRHAQLSPAPATPASLSPSAADSPPPIRPHIPSAPRSLSLHSAPLPARSQAQSLPLSDEASASRRFAVCATAPIAHRPHSRWSGSASRIQQDS